MPTVVAAVVRRKRAFLGVAAARIVGDVGGGGREWTTRLFGCRAIMIAHARASGRFGAMGPAYQWQMQPPVVNAHDAQFLGSVAPPNL
jgi:hypothetical protein